jgi:hypothetical protein
MKTADELLTQVNAFLDALPYERTPKSLYEPIRYVLPMVVKKDGRREQFDRQKILTGIKKACEKRPISMEAIDKLVENVEQACQELEEKQSAYRDGIWKRDDLRKNYQSFEIVIFLLSHIGLV